MNFKEWLSSILDTSKICDEYNDKVKNAQSKKQMMDIVLDSNGLPYMCQMSHIGQGLPYDVITKEFAPFINGAYIGYFNGQSGCQYSGSIYCGLKDGSSVVVETTATCFLGCKCDVFIQDYDFVQIYADDNCELTIHCSERGKCYVDYWGDAKIFVEGDSSRVLIEQNF